MCFTCVMLFIVYIGCYECWALYNFIDKFKIFIMLSNHLNYVARLECFRKKIETITVEDYFLSFETLSLF